MSEITQKTLPELLAPAGTVAAGFASIDAGADAVYAGLPRFNARERGENLTFEDLARLMSYANRHSRNVYVTLNTLIKESELTDVAAVLGELASLRPSAVIVQDIGVVRLIRDHFPELTIHASTQMAIHNSAGARVAQKMGIERVILERQVTFEEIRAIRKATTIELEIFVHGALCCSRSGVCLFSSWMGGWSGNRGRCKQPCRRRYFSPDGNGFFFSPGDLCSIDDIPALIDLGVSSLKIEGRLRRVDYVHHVVQAYRMVLDAPENERRKRAKEARAVLAGSLGRKWMAPFRSPRDFEEVIQHQSLGTSGLLVGEVKGVDKHGFSVKLSRPIGLRDVLRVQPRSGDEGPTVPVLQLRVEGRPVHRVERGQICHVGTNAEIPAGGMVFKIGALPRDDLAKRIAATAPLPPAIDLRVQLEGKQVRVECSPLGVSWAAPVSTQPARERPLTSEQLATEFARSGDSPVRAGRTTALVADGLFLPPSELKRLRRAFWEWLEEEASPLDVMAAWRDQADGALGGIDVKGVPADVPMHVVRLPHGRPPPQSDLVLAHALDDFDSDTREIVLPDFVPEPQLLAVKRRIAEAIGSGKRCFRVTSLFALDLLGEYDRLSLTASYPLPVANRAAVAELQSWGVDKVTAWVELDRHALEALLGACPPGVVQVYCRGWLPLLFTRFKVPVQGRVTDARGNAFHIRSDKIQTRLYPEKTFAIEPPAGASTFADLTDDRTDSATSDFNDPREWL